MNPWVAVVMSFLIGCVLILAAPSLSRLQARQSAESAEGAGFDHDESQRWGKFRGFEAVWRIRIAGVLFVGFSIWGTIDLLT